MVPISKESIADVRMTLSWRSEGARHREVYEALGLNLWRDLLPAPVLSALEGSVAGDRLRIEAAPGEILPVERKEQRFAVPRSRFDTLRSGRTVEPCGGRFYPKGLLSGLPQVFPQNVEPFRCISVENGTLGVDFNHPLAGKKAAVDLQVKAVREKTDERGGTCRVWIEELADGPGMQARWNGRPTDFFSSDPFSRQDEQDDADFYRRPRLVQHIDDAAIGIVRRLYKEHLAPGMAVLDLMSSWQSHVPEDIRLTSLTGLGMNEAELAANPQLTERIVHDLNSEPTLPFAAESFDAALCTVSVEYLTRPAEVFAELARVLRPGAPFVVTFSDRWFPPKAIRIWADLHDFERMGLVSEYFRGTGRFSGLETVSVRGLPRPMDDKYFPQRIYADPVYAVIGRRQA
ncbi:MAG: methyltransferase domain-containing protein [Desulfobacterales bacterium]